MRLQFSPLIKVVKLLKNSPIFHYFQIYKEFSTINWIFVDYSY